MSRFKTTNFELLPWEINEIIDEISEISDEAIAWFRSRVTRPTRTGEYRNVRGDLVTVSRLAEGRGTMLQTWPEFISETEAPEAQLSVEDLQDLDEIRFQLLARAHGFPE